MTDIRLATSDDWPALRAMNRRHFGEAACARGGRWWIGSDPVCFAAARSHRHGRHWGCYLLRAAVNRSHRGQGLHSALVRARLDWAAEQGMKWAWTYTSSDNAASMRTLIRCGFMPWAPRSFAGRPAGDWVHWRYKL